MADAGVFSGGVAAGRGSPSLRSRWRLLLLQLLSQFRSSNLYSGQFGPTLSAHLCYWASAIGLRRSRGVLGLGSDGDGRIDRRDSGRSPPPIPADGARIHGRRKPSPPSTERAATAARRARGGTSQPRHQVCVLTLTLSLASVVSSSSRSKLSQWTTLQLPCR